MTEELINMTDSYTLNGEPVRVLCVDAEGKFPVLVQIQGEHAFRNEIFAAINTGLVPGMGNLVKVKPKRTVEFWVNMYPGEIDGIYVTKERADHLASKARIACLHFTSEFEEGEGL